MATPLSDAGRACTQSPPASHSEMPLVQRTCQPVCSIVSAGGTAAVARVLNTSMVDIPLSGPVRRARGWGRGDRNPCTWPGLACDAEELVTAVNMAGWGLQGQRLDVLLLTVGCVDGLHTTFTSITYGLPGNLLRILAMADGSGSKADMGMALIQCV